MEGKLVASREAAKRVYSRSPLSSKARRKPHQRRAVNSALIEEVLQHSIELLDVVQSYQRRTQAARKSAEEISAQPSPVKRSFATQTTEDKSTQVSLEPSTRSSQTSSEIEALKEDIKAISRRLRDINSSRTHSSFDSSFKTPEKSSDRTSERLSFVDSPEFRRKTSCYS